MIWITVVLLAVSLLCLVFSETRKLGITGLAVVLMLHPLLFLALLLLGGAIVYAKYIHTRRKKDELLRLPYHGD